MKKGSEILRKKKARNKKKGNIGRKEYESVIKKRRKKKRNRKEKMTKKIRKKGKTKHPQ